MLIRILSPKQFLKAIHTRKIKAEDLLSLKISNVTFESSNLEMLNAIVMTFPKCRISREKRPFVIVYESSIYQKTIGMSGNSVLLTDLLAKVYRRFSPYADIKLNKSAPCVFTPYDSRIKVILGIIRPVNIDFEEYYREYLTIAYTIKLLNRLDVEIFLEPYKKLNRIVEIPLTSFSDYEFLHTGKLARAIRNKEIDLVELNKMTYADAYKFLMNKFSSKRSLSVETRMKYFFNVYLNESIDRSCITLKPLFGE